jgi:hypothetical protein
MECSPEAPVEKINTFPAFHAQAWKRQGPAGALTRPLIPGIAQRIKMLTLSPLHTSHSDNVLRICLRKKWVNANREDAEELRAISVGWYNFRLYVKSQFVAVN